MNPDKNLVKNKKEQKGMTNNPNGRPKGSLNKRTLEALEVFGDFCPLEKIIEKLKEPVLQEDHELYLNTCLRLMKFKFPERKAVEHGHDLGALSTEELVIEAIDLLKSMGVEHL